LKGDKREVRDNLLMHISFRAGSAKAFLTYLEWSFSGKSKETNNHLGNFVIYDYKGSLLVGVTDICDAKTIYDFKDGDLEYTEEERVSKSKIKFDKHAQYELDSYEEDFMWGNVGSFPTQFYYRHFSEKLRRDCFDAFKTGYVSHLEYLRRKADHIHQIKVPKRLIIPDGVYVGTNEFREQIAFVLDK